MEHVLARRRGEARPHRHRHAVRVRPSDALRSRARAFRCVTTKKLHVKSIVHELLWFLRGDTNVKYLQRPRRHASGTNGRMRTAISARSMASNGAPGRRATARPSTRSAMWCEAIKRNPDSRRLIVSAWNPADIDKMALPPCHCLFQFYVAEGRLSCQLYQRSADIFLGVPFNIASYALLTMMVAQVTGLKPGEFVHTLRRRASLSQIIRAGASAIVAPAARAADDDARSGGEGSVRVPLRRFHADRLRAAPAYQGRGRGVSAASSPADRPVSNIDPRRRRRRERRDRARQCAAVADQIRPAIFPRPSPWASRW